MGTRSSISYVNKKGQITSVYCHKDGYPEHQLPILKKHFAKTEDVEELVKMGGVSVLDVSIEKPKGEHSLLDRQSGYSLFYNRDEGRELEITLTENLDDFKKNWCGGMIAYHYIFNNNNWLSYTDEQLKTLKSL
jgi:hypothetical protein